MSLLGSLAIFTGGALFGTVGIKVLTSEDAKKFYAFTAAAAIRAADKVIETAVKISEGCNEILDKADEINRDYYAGEGKSKDSGSADGISDDWEDFEIEEDDGDGENK